MHSEQESFRKRNKDYWHIREEMIGNVEQELQTRMGGRSRQKVSGERKHHVKGRHPQKLVWIDVKERICYNARLFVVIWACVGWHLTNLTPDWVINLIIWFNSSLYVCVQSCRSDLDPVVFPPEPPKWCLDLPPKSPRLLSRHQGTKRQPSPRLPHPLPRRWWQTSYPSKNKTIDVYFSSSS